MDDAAEDNPPPSSADASTAAPSDASLDAPSEASSDAPSDASSDTQPTHGTTAAPPAQPRHGAPPEARRVHPRRWFLAGACVAVLAAAGGVGAAFVRKRPSPAHTSPPARLVRAIAAEQLLIADLDATTGGADEVRRVIVQARADHAAHLTALRGVLATYDPPTRDSPTRSSASPSTTTAPVGTPRTAAHLRRSEQQAAARAAADALALNGSLAVLLASIAACEASHAELLA